MERSSLEKESAFGAAEYVLPCICRDELACAYLKAECCAGGWHPCSSTSQAGKGVFVATRCPRTCPAPGLGLRRQGEA